MKWLIASRKREGDVQGAELEDEKGEFRGFVGFCVVFACFETGSSPGSSGWS